MDTYHCPTCGETVTRADGCRGCGRPYDQDVAALALFQRTVASLEQRKRDLTSEQLTLRTQLQHASAQRDALNRKVRQKLEGQAAPKGALRKRIMRRGEASPRPPAAPVPPAAPPAGPAAPPSAPRPTPPVRPAAQPPAGPPPTLPARLTAQPPAGPTGPTDPPGSSPTTASGLPSRAARQAMTGPAPQRPPAPPAGTARPGRPAGAPPGGVPAGNLPPRIAARLPEVMAASKVGGRRRVLRVPAGSRPPVRGPGRLAGAETTTGTAQNVLLGTGGLLLAGAAIVLAVVAFATVGTAGRVALMAAATPVALAVPILLARRQLTATAETVASVGLLLVLLDGYVLWSLRLLGTRGVPVQLYFGLVCLGTAVVATVYGGVSRLAAPRFAAVLLLQPVLPLFAYPWIAGPAGWSLVLVAVAALDLIIALNLVIAMNLAGPDRLAALQRPLRPAPGRPATGDAGTVLALREVTWVLFALAFGGAFGYALTAIATATTLPPTVRAASVLLLTAAVGLAGGIAWRRRPLPDLAGGLATLAVIVAVTRVGAVALPGHTLLVGSAAVALAVLIVPALPPAARLGPAIAGSAAAAFMGLLLLVRGLPAIVAPVAAASPVWRADLARYPQRLADAAGPGGWQLVVAGLLLTLALALALPVAVRTEAVLAGSALTLLMAPAAGRLDWRVGPLLLVASAITAGALATRFTVARTAHACLGAAAVLGGYAAAISLTRPGATALTLTALTFGCVLVAAARPDRAAPDQQLLAMTVSDVAAGGAAAALPGAVACGMAALISTDVTPHAGTTAVLAAGFLAVSAAVGYVAIIQVARRSVSPPLVLGAAAGAAGVAAAALLSRANPIDIGVGLLLLGSAVLLWFAPTLERRRIFGQELDGPEVAAAAVTASVLGALSRVLSLALPDAGLVVSATLVLALALALYGLPATWRRGPVAGGAAVAVGIAVATGIAAVGGGIGVVRAASPVWHADLGQRWLDTAGEYAWFGWQTPVALLLVAVASWLVVPEPYGEDAAAITLGLAAVAAPVALSLAWWSPMLLGVLTAMALGLSAAFARSARPAYTRVTMAGLVGLYAAGASLARAAATAGTLESLAMVGVVVAGVAGLRLAAARSSTARTSRAHLVPVGGTALASAVLALAGAAAALAAGLGHAASVTLAGTLAAASVALAVCGVVCWRMPAFLGYVTAGVSASATVVALASLSTPLPTGVYAAAGALLCVLAELLRLSIRQRLGWRPADGWQPAGGWRPDRTWLPVLRWRPARPGFGIGVTLATAVPATIAVLILAPALTAALFGPYHWARRPWTGTPSTAGDLGMLGRWAGTPADVMAAAVLTLAGALIAVGLTGARDAVASRAVGVAVPGAAVTILIAPAALGWPGPLHATAALLVSTMCQLGLSLTNPAPDTADAAGLRIARRVVFVLAVLSAGAGLAGSLATRSMTIETLAGSVVVGLIGALGGRTLLARVMEWQVATGAAVLLALAGGLAAGWPATWCAFPVLGVAALLIGLGSALPVLRPSGTAAQEAAVIEAMGYAGTVLALGLTYGAPRYSAAACLAVGPVLGLAASRPGRPEGYRRALIIGGAASEVIGLWLLMRLGHVALIEAYTVPFAAFALLVGVLELRRRPDVGSWVAYGPALLAGFLPTLVVVLISDSDPLRRVGLIVAAVLTVAFGAVRRQKAPVVVGSAVTGVATLHELILFGRFLPWWVLLVLFTATGVLLVSLGGTYEKRRHDVARLRGALGRMR